jgi:hypothetical protein
MSKNAFVIMPFSATTTCTAAQWTEIYDNIFRPAFEDCGYSCQRAQPMTGSLAATIIDSLRCANIVLADLTDRNPNVFYELGIRHCLRKGTILAAQGSQHIPSDLTGLWFIDYGIRPGEVSHFKSEIKRLTFEIERDPEKSDNPVADYLDKEHITILGHSRRDAIKKLGALYTELTGLQNILAEMAKTPKASHFLSSDCLQLLCHTMYIDVGTELLGRAYHLIYALEQLAQSPTDGVLLNHTGESVRSFAREIHNLRDLLIRGDYNEPPVVSTMVWVPLETPVDVRNAFSEEAIKEILMPLSRLGEQCLQVSLSETCSGSEEVMSHMLTRAGELLGNRMASIYLYDAESHTLSPASEGKPLDQSLRAVGAHEEASNNQVPAINLHDSGSSGHRASSTGKPSIPFLPGDRSARNKPCPCGSGKRFKNCCWSDLTPRRPRS